ncbi:MAG TPA: alpha/beta hydrolase [Thermomicrobiaceae bacterium]|nr:alpha/beta hydrolase [Thermomicrobiaceae bacterium]
MPLVERPDGARIHYEVRGEGTPLLLFAPGGISSQISFWQSSALNPFDFADEFMVIGMDQRNADQSSAPLAAPTWEDCAADQLAVMDDLGIERTLLWGGCIGVAYVLRLAHDAPERVIAAVGQDPVGFYPGVNTRDTFFDMFKPTIAAARQGGMQAVVDAAFQDGLFMRNNAAGPFAPRIVADSAFREQVLQLDPGEYEKLIHDYDDQIWGAHGTFMSVEEPVVPTIETPLLILPGTDEFHPTEVARRICAEAPNATCLDPDCRSPEKLPQTRQTVLAFLRKWSAAESK